MKKAWLALVFGSAIFLAACGGGDEENNTNNGANGEVTDAELDGEAIVKESCIGCHGGDLGGMGNIPSLQDVGSRYSEEEILNIILNGKGGMPAGLLEGAEAEAAAAWLATQK